MCVQSTPTNKEGMGESVSPTNKLKPCGVGITHKWQEVPPRTSLGICDCLWVSRPLPVGGHHQNVGAALPACQAQVAVQEIDLFVCSYARPAAIPAARLRLHFNNHDHFQERVVLENHRSPHKQPRMQSAVKHNTPTSGTHMFYANGASAAECSLRPRRTSGPGRMFYHTAMST